MGYWGLSGPPARRCCLVCGASSRGVESGGATSSCPSALLLNISTGELLEPFSQRVRRLLCLVKAGDDLLMPAGRCDPEAILA